MRETSIKKIKCILDLYTVFLKLQHIHIIKIFFLNFNASNSQLVVIKMKVVLCLLLCASVAVAIPVNGEEGAKFANEAISQAQQSLLIPRDAIIHNVSKTKTFLLLLTLIKFTKKIQVEKSVPLASYENLPANQPIDLFMILGDQVHTNFSIINNVFIYII